MKIGNKTPTENNTTYTINFWEVVMITSIGNKIQYYSLILTILIGIPGNIISLLIFIKPCLNTKTNTGLLYTLLCALNLIALLFNLLVKNPSVIFNYGIHLSIRIEIFIGNVLLQMMSWLQVLITFDGFITMMFPMRGVKIMRKRWVLYSIIFGMLVSIVGLNSLYFFKETFDYKDRRRKSFCLIIIKVSIQLFLPYLILVILDFIAFMRLRKDKTILSERQSMNSNSSDKSTKLTRNTILANLIYLIFNLPSAIFDIYVIANIRSEMFAISTIYLSLISEVFIDVFTYIYPSFLFILFIVFNKVFRDEFVALINQQRLFIFIKRIFCRSFY